MRKLIKPVDLIVILLVIACSLIVTQMYAYDGAKYVVIYTDGKEFGRYSIENNQTIEVSTDYGRNVVVIENNIVRVSETTCKDKVEINAGEISRGGQSLVCLPNRFVVTIEGGIQTDATAF